MPDPALARVRALVAGWANDFHDDDLVRIGDVVDDLTAALDGTPHTDQHNHEVNHP